METNLSGSTQTLLVACDVAIGASIAIAVVVLLRTLFRSDAKEPRSESAVVPDGVEITSDRPLGPEELTAIHLLLCRLYGHDFASQVVELAIAKTAETAAEEIDADLERLQAEGGAA